MTKPGGWLTRNLVILTLVSLTQDAASELLYPLLPLIITGVLVALLAWQAPATERAEAEAVTLAVARTIAEMPAVAEAVTVPRRIMDAVNLLPGHARSQVLTYASVHNLRVVGDDRQLKVHLGPDVLDVDFDDQGRIAGIRGSLGSAPLQ